MTSDLEDAASPDRDHSNPDLEDDQDDLDMAEASFISKDSKGDGYDVAPNGKSKSSKDPQRPRRKKARRACHACQRAHLTCGDERPCQRCVKRGLQDQCQDGFRKKAKYLHDAPAEALIPPTSLGGNFTFSEPKTPNAQGNITPQTPMTQQTAYFPPAQAMELYAQNQTPMAALLASSAGSYGNITTTPISPFNLASTQSGQMNAPSLLQTSGPNMPSQQQTPQPAHQIPFDPSDPAIFNFNIDGLNFGNRYGALEFGMLQTMANGVNDNPHDVVTPLNSHVPSYSLNFGGGSPALFDQNAMMGMNYGAAPATAIPRHPPSNPELKTPNNTPIIKSADVIEGHATGPYAYAIGAPQRPNSLASASPVSLAQDAPGMGENNTGSPAVFASGGEFAVNHHSHASHHQPVQHPQNAVTTDSLPNTSGNPSSGRKRLHNADSIYSRPLKPYSYHAGWHRLFSYIKTHFSKENVQRIAQYVSVIRPPLTAFAQSLSGNDLSFMETFLQRQLFEYREFIKATGTPTIVTRRDGTILAVSEEFCKMTRWGEAIVLGKEKNLNVNRGQALGKKAMAEEKGEGSGGDGQALLISEVFDQQTVVDFFNDYARLAFGDPMGRALRRGKLLRYITREEALVASKEIDIAQSDPKASTTSADGKKAGNTSGEREEPGIASEGAFLRLGEKRELLTACIAGG